ncbi:methyl-accepting chemotaxis protein [Anaeromyxobacter paludicola]|uniref:Methyl-accepting chemotaxis sensory transducer n=1 Tax=Anaeromyxobacter paludicola TaxID=2918171 RepID=A0ABM7X532_9BACT|nr:methyl-accepting chemotaxis protein [Anaeromyxobacter paludicola]BDG06922.1 hypothetical protein AMPC_00350 [Anaeromyxobacter paludicola]
MIARTRSLKVQILSAAALTVAVAAAVGVTSVLTARSGDQLARALPVVRTTTELMGTLVALDDAAAKLTDSRISDPAQRRELLERARRDLARLDEASQRMERLPAGPEHRALWEKFKPLRDAWRQNAETLLSLQEKKDQAGPNADQAAALLADAQSMEVFVAMAEGYRGAQRILAQVVDGDAEAAGRVGEAATAALARGAWVTLLACLGGLLGLVVVSLAVRRSIQRTTTTLVSEAEALCAAVAAGNLDRRASEEGVSAEFRGVAAGMNRIVDALVEPLRVAAGQVDRIARGEIPAPVEAPWQGELGRLRDNLNQCAAAVDALLSDVSALGRAAMAGEIRQRADVSRHRGDFGRVVQEVNGTLDALVNPLTVAADYVARISRGELPEKIDAAYQGEFNAIKDNLNRCIEAVGALVTDARTLSAGAVEGRLSVRADASRHQGEFRAVVQGVNDTLDALTGPLAAAARCVEQISKGAIPPRITERYAGDFNAIKDNLNQCIDAVNALVADAKGLAAAAVEGRLATRADASRHHGDFRLIVQGVNDALDAVVGPLRTAAGYVERISRGDIPPRIAERWAGDFDLLKASLDRSAAAIQQLVSDARGLAEEAVAGHLGRRADASRHQGDFRRIVEGVNATLDAVLAPIGEANEVLERLAERDLTARMTGRYQGDHARLQTAVNGTAEALEQALERVAGSVEQLSSAASQIAASSQAVAGGASQQAASLEQTSASLESVAGMAKGSAESAAQASRMVHGAKEAAVEGAGAMAQMQTAMSRIRVAAESTSAIIRDINEIAFQTNLLALNAAVEAARAGEAGRGFAVVAEEVRSLAMRSKEAATKTEALIGESVSQAAEGADTSKRVSGKLEEIVAAIGKVTDIAAEIAAAAREQSAGVGQLNRAVDEMDRVTQQNAASAEESSSTAAELARQAEDLSALVSGFKLAGQRQLAGRSAA